MYLWELKENYIRPLSIPQDMFFVVPIVWYWIFVLCLNDQFICSSLLLHGPTHLIIKKEQYENQQSSVVIVYCLAIEKVYGVVEI